MSKTNMWVAFCQGIFITLSGVAVLILGLSLSYSLYEAVDKTLLERKMEVLKFEHSKELTALKLERDELWNNLQTEERKNRYEDYILKMYKDAGCGIVSINGKFVATCKLEEKGE